MFVFEINPPINHVIYSAMCFYEIYTAFAWRFIEWLYKKIHIANRKKSTISHKEQVDFKEFYTKLHDMTILGLKDFHNSL